MSEQAPTQPQTTPATEPAEQPAKAEIRHIQKDKKWRRRLRRKAPNYTIIDTVNKPRNVMVYFSDRGKLVRTRTELISPRYKTDTGLSLSADRGDEYRRLDEFAMRTALQLAAVPETVTMAERTFVHYYNCLPNQSFARNIDIDLFLAYIDTLGLAVREKLEKSDVFPEKPVAMWKMFIFERPLLIDILYNETTHSRNSKVIYDVNFYHTEPLESYGIDIAKIRTFRHEVNDEEESSVFLVDSFGELVRMDIPKRKVSITDNYNESLYEFDQKMMAHINTQHAVGLFLLHGKPGTGKTYYLNYLINSCNRSVIYLPVSEVGMLSATRLMQLLTHQNNSVLVIEDAESVLVDRGEVRSQLTSALLNLTDGILSDLLSVTVVATFNTSVSDIDPALMRKGRLRGIYEFTPLEPEKANHLLAQLGHQHTTTKPMLLADVFNYEAPTGEYNDGRSSAGFKL